MRTQVLIALPLAAISIFIMGWDMLVAYNLAAPMSPVLSEFFHHLLAVMATYVLFVIGKPYWLGMLRFLRHG